MVLCGDVVLTATLRRILPCLVIFLTACTSVTTKQPEAIALGPVFEVTSDEDLLQGENAWWREFNDAELSAWVAASLAQNYSLQAARARLDQSMASWRSSRSDYYPTLDANVGRSRTWTESGNIQSTNNQWNAGLSTSYEVDLWGSIGASSAQSKYTSFSREASIRTLANTVAGQVATAWLGLRKETQMLALLNSQQQRIESALKVVQGRYQRGQTSVTDVWQQQQLLESIHADIITSEGQRSIYRQQLALWAGVGDAALSDEQMNQLAPLPPLNLLAGRVGSEALKKRPDVEVAFYDLQAAGAGLAAAVANRYPRFTLSASYQGQDERFSNVLDNWMASLAGSLVMPLIDGGQRRAEVERQRALETEAVANYQQTLLEAAQEVQEALISEQQSAALVQSLTRQLILSKQTEAIQHSSYRRGVAGFLELLSVQQDVLTLETRLLEARWAQVLARIQLYKSVSHGQFTEEGASQ